MKSYCGKDHLGFQQERAQFLPRKTRIIERRWNILYNEDAHHRLKTAVRQEVWEQNFGNVDDGEEIDDFDPTL